MLDILKDYYKINPEEKKKILLHFGSKNYILINSTNLEYREEKITSILITMRNNPSLTAKIIKANSKKITQEYMDFLILNFYDPLQPKSCSCKSSFHIYEFIKELFIYETKYIDSYSDLIDNCPLLFKLVASLFNHVHLFDFLAVFLKKLLKKKYLKELVNQRDQAAQENVLFKRKETVEDNILDFQFEDSRSRVQSNSQKRLNRFSRNLSTDFSTKMNFNKKQKKYGSILNVFFDKNRSERRTRFMNFQKTFPNPHRNLMEGLSSCRESLNYGDRNLSQYFFDRSDSSEINRNSTPSSHQKSYTGNFYSFKHLNSLFLN